MEMGVLNYFTVRGCAYWYVYILEALAAGL